MDDNAPKPKVWNFDSDQIDNSPELQRQQPVDWSSVGDGMAKNVSEHLVTRWYFNTPFVVAILAISAFVSRLLGVILILIFMSRVIMVTIRANRSASKSGAIIGWLVVTILFIGVALFI